MKITALVLIAFIMLWVIGFLMYYDNANAAMTEKVVQNEMKRTKKQMPVVYVPGSIFKCGQVWATFCKQGNTLYVASYRPRNPKAFHKAFTKFYEEINRTGGAGSPR